MKRRVVVAAVVSLAVAYIFGCQTQHGEMQSTQPVATESTGAVAPLTDPEALPDRYRAHIDGSTSCQPIHMQIICNALGLEPVWVMNDPPRHSFSEETTRRFLPLVPRNGGQLSEADDYPRLGSAFHHMGTSSAYLLTSRESGRLALEARKPIQQELSYSGEDVELDVTPIAMDALVFILHNTNPVEWLDLDQIRDIFTGEITNWAEVGGEDEPIVPLTRDETSGSQGLMRELVIGDAKMVEGTAFEGFTMSAPISGVRGHPDGIGYSVHYYIRFMSPDPRVKFVEINGVAPTPETIRSGEYPLCSEVYAVIRADETPESPARKLRDWLLTEDGQRVIAKSGYVPISEAKRPAETEAAETAGAGT